MPIRDYAGAAKPTTLFPGITATATSFTVADGTGYPLGGAAGNFVITIDVGRAAEEKILCATRSGNSFTVATGGRGWDGTTAAAHDSQAPVQHTYSATDAREANAHVNDTTGDPHPQYLTAAEVPAPTAATVSFIPAAGIAATQVQAAIEEVVSDASVAYAPKASPTLTGTVTENDGTLSTRMRHGFAFIAVAQSTTSTTAADLTTIGPDVLFVAPPSGRLTAQYSAVINSGNGFGSAFLTITRVSDGVVVVPPDDLVSLLSPPNNDFASFSASRPIENLTPGVQYRARLRYRSHGGQSVSFNNRFLTIVPSP